RKTATRFQVIDLDSVNGTKLNGQYLSSQHEHYWEEGIPCSILEWDFAIIDLHHIRRSDVSIKLGGAGVIPSVQYGRDALVSVRFEVVRADGRYAYAVTVLPQYRGWHVTPAQDRVLNAGEQYNGDVSLSVDHAVRSGHYPTHLAILRKFSGLWQIVAVHPFTVLVESRPQLTTTLDLKDGRAKLGEEIRLELRNEGNVLLNFDMSVGDSTQRLEVALEPVGAENEITIEPGNNRIIELRPGLARRWGPWRYHRFFGKPEEMGFKIHFEPMELSKELYVMVMSVPLLPSFAQILLPALLLLLLILFGVLLRPQVELHGETACFDATPTPIYSNVASGEITRNLCADVRGIGWTAVKVDGKKVTPVSTIVSQDYRVYEIEADPRSSVSIEHGLPFYRVQAAATPVATVQYVPKIQEIEVSPSEAYCGQTVDLDIEITLDHQLDDDAGLLLTASRGMEEIFNLRDPKKIGDSNLYRFARTLESEIACGEKFDAFELTLEVTSFASSEAVESKIENLRVIPPICTVIPGATFYVKPLLNDIVVTPVPAQGAKEVYVIQDHYRHRDGTEWIRVSYNDQEWYLMTMYLNCEAALNSALEKRLFSEPAPYDEPTSTPIPTSTNTPVPPPPAPPTPEPTSTPPLDAIDQNEGWYAAFRPIPNSSDCILEGEGFSGIEGIWLLNKETNKREALGAPEGRIVGVRKSCASASQWMLEVEKKDGEVKSAGLRRL
ncbi:MAG: hypothetical protein KC547_17480, partial [Anaerolineae bacterium]|nr:hypothetical protein [Anaerolineae bacterium]